MSSIAITHRTPIIIHLITNQYHKNGGYFAGIIYKSLTNHYNHSDIKGWNIRYVTCTFPYTYITTFPTEKPGGLSRLLHGHGGPALPNPLTLPQALSFGLDVARGVQYLHSHLVGNPQKTDELELETQKKSVVFLLVGFLSGIEKVETGNHSIKQDILTEESMFQCVLSRCSKLWLHFLCCFPLGRWRS